jgi:glycine oxidase
VSIHFSVLADKAGGVIVPLDQCPARMGGMRQWDAIVIGGGAIGLSLARELQKRGRKVLVVERGEPGREASHAAGGMLAFCEPHLAPPLRALALESARIYPEFVGEIEAESGLGVDWRREGCLALDHDEPGLPGCRRLSADEVRTLEPRLRAVNATWQYWPESSVDPRALVAAVEKAARVCGVEMITGEAVTSLQRSDGQATGVETARGQYDAPVVVNCAGAWAAQIDTGSAAVAATRPVKGQMLAVRPATPVLRHVVRTPQVYLIPRSDGRIVIGATVEEAGFDKRTDPAVIQRLHDAAAEIIPELGEAKIVEAWAGLRPGSPDGMPILGSTAVEGYFLATGHYRDGILLAPVTARVMSDLIDGRRLVVELEAFAVERAIRA